MIILALVIRLEEEKDWRKVEEYFIPQLDFVAELDGRLVGNIMYCKGYVLMPTGIKKDVIGFGPVSVLPAYQKHGIGSALIRHSLGIAKSKGYGSVIIYGHPTYYPRFGFKEAKAFGITTRDGKNFPAFMAIELIEGALSGITGCFHESPAYSVDPIKACKYDLIFE